MRAKKGITKIVNKQEVNKIVDEIASKMAGIKHGSIITEEIKKLKELFK